MDKKIYDNNLNLCLKSYYPTMKYIFNFTEYLKANNLF